MTVRFTGAYAALGVVFGFVLSRSGAADYDYIQAMFLFEDPQLFLIIGTAVLISAPGLWLMKHRGRSAMGAPLSFPPRALQPGQVAGGAIFGVGWAIAGMCPGPIWVNIGEGKIYALAALAGALTGTAAYGWMAPRLGAASSHTAEGSSAISSRTGAVR